MADDGIDDLHTHLVWKLNRVSVDLAVLDRLPTFGLSIEAHDQHPRLSSLFQCRPRTERRRIVDCEHAAEIRVGLQCILRCLEADVLGAATFKLGNDFDL